MKKIAKLSVLLVAILIVFLTYNSFSDEKGKIKYIALGDSVAYGVNSYRAEEYGYPDYLSEYFKKNTGISLYTKEFSKSGYEIEDIVDEIDNNLSLEINDTTIYLKEALRESDVVTITVGANDYLKTLDLSNIADLILDVEETKKLADEIITKEKDLLELVKKYAKNKIVVTGYYNPLPYFKTRKEEIDEIVKYFNNQLEYLCDDLDIIYVDIFDIFDGNTEYLPNPLDIHPNTKGYEQIAKRIIEVLEVDK